MPPSYTEQLDTLYTTTWQIRRREIADQVFTATPLFHKLDQRGNRKTQTGGRRIEQPLAYGKNTSVAWIGRGDTVQFEEQDVLTVAYYEWKYLTGHILRYFQDDQRNRGKAQHIDRAAFAVDNLRDSLTDELEGSMFSDGTDDEGKQIDGLQVLVADAPVTGTVGGIDRATYSWWRNNYKDVTGEEVSVYLLTRMRKMYNDCGVYGGQGINRFPDLNVTTQALYELYEEEAASLGQIVITNDQALVDLGFGQLSFKGVPLTWSPSCPDHKMYFLNTYYMNWVIDPIEYLNLGAWQNVPNSPRDRVAHSMTVGNITLSNSRKQGVLFNVGN